MKTLLTSAALSLALAVPAFAQDAKPVVPPTAAPQVTAPAVQVPAVKAEAPKAAAPVAAPAVRVEAPKAVTPTVAPKAEAKAPAVAPKADAKAAATPAKADAKAVAKLVNLNTATAKELDALPSIGKARTKAIIAGRPYNAVDDLLTKKVLPKDSFEAVKAKVSVK